jgi:hypothetical protein
LARYAHDPLKPALNIAAAYDGYLPKLETNDLTQQADRQALAAIGQVNLAHRWEVALAAHGLVAAQLLLTYDDFTERERYLHLESEDADATGNRTARHQDWPETNLGDGSELCRDGVEERQIQATLGSRPGNHRRAIFNVPWCAR